MHHVKAKGLFSDGFGRLAATACVVVFLASVATAQRSFRLDKYVSKNAGDEWQFKNNVKDGLSPIVVKTSQYVPFAGKRTIRRDENNGDYRLQTIDRNGLTIYRLYFVGDRFIDYESPIVLMPRQLKLGDVFKSESRYATRVKDEVTERGKQTYEVKIETVEHVKTPFRSFDDCLVVRTTALRVDDSGSQKGYELVEWLAKGVGAVKVKGELFWKDNKGKTTRVFKVDADLESFKNVQAANK